MNWNRACLVSILVLSTTLTSCYGKRFRRLFGFADEEILGDDSDFQDNTIGFLGRALSVVGVKASLKSMDYLEEDADGIKLGCRFDLGTEDKKVRALYIEDVKGRRELARVGSTIGRFLNSSKLEEERVIPLRTFPEDCLRVLFGIDTGFKGCPLGPTGPAGPAGNPGGAGPNGSPGRAGANGTPGQDGLAGSDGVVGRPGLVGVMGNTGVQGPAGAAGSQGPVGPNGPDGADGPNGSPGNRGNPGNPGLPGSNGLAGQDGPIGGIGPAGVNGSNGDPGANGSPGVDGPPAPNTRYGTPDKVYAIAQNFPVSSSKVDDIAEPVADAGIQGPEIPEPLADARIQVPEIAEPLTTTERNTANWVSDNQHRPLQVSNFWKYGRQDEVAAGWA